MKHIKLYFIALLIACCMLMVCPFASAESMSVNQQEVIENYISGELPSNFSIPMISALREHVFPYCQYFGTFYISSPGTIILTFSSNLSVMPVALYSGWGDPPCQVQVGIHNSIADFGGLISFSESSISNYYGFRLIFYDSTWSLYGVKNYTGSISTKYGDTYFGGGSLTKYAGTSSMNNSNWFNPNSVNWIKSYGFGPVWIACSSDRQYIIQSANNIEPIIYTEDNRLKLYKLWSSQNGDSLVVDLSEFRTYTAAAAYNFSNIVLTLTCNGVDTQYTLPLTSSTINNGWDNSSNLYTISTPVSDFTLSETYDTYITKVSFNLDFSSPGGTGSTPFYISTNFPLDVHHSIITPDIIPTPATVYDDPAKPIDISDRQYDLFQQLQSNVAGGDIVYVNNYPVLPSWANVYNLNTFFYDNKPDDLNIYHGVQITGNYFIDSKYDFDIKSFLYDNANSAYYDVVIIRIDNTVWPSVVTNNTIPDSQQLYGYVVLYTSTYYMRLDAETQINILEAIQLDAKQSIENWKWLVDIMDDFENKSLDILNPLYDETTYIDDKLASILYAVNNIESYNDSSIVTLLTDIKSLLSNPENEIDTPQECILLYEAHPDYFNELWGTPTPALRSASVTPNPNNPYVSSDYVRADLIPAWWEGKTLTMVYILKNDGDTSRFYDSILGGLFDAYENLIESDSSFTNYIDSLFKTGYDYTDSFYGHLFDLNYDPEEWEGGFGTSE